MDNAREHEKAPKCLSRLWNFSVLTPSKWIQIPGSLLPCKGAGHWAACHEGAGHWAACPLCMSPCCLKGNGGLWQACRSFPPLTMSHIVWAYFYSRSLKTGSLNGLIHVLLIKAIFCFRCVLCLSQMCLFNFPLWSGWSVSVDRTLRSQFQISSINKRPLSYVFKR